MRFHRRTTQLLGAACLGVVAGGCHEYIPVRTGTPVPPNTTVRATLTDVGTVALGPVLGPHIRMIEGALVSRTDSALVLRVTQATRTDGTEQTINGDQVDLNAGSVQDVGYVRTAVARSAILAAAIVTAAVVGASGFGRQGTPVTGRGVGGPATGQ